MKTFARGFLIFCGLGFVLIGLNTFHDPLAAMALVDLNVNTVSALNELRANYGGLQIGMGLWLFAGAWRAPLMRPALLAQGLLVGGLACGRLVSIALDGLPSPMVQSFLAVEVVTAVVSALLWVKLSNDA